jgi:hypothetical protein
MQQAISNAVEHIRQNQHPTNTVRLIRMAVKSTSLSAVDGRVCRAGFFVFEFGYEDQAGGLREPRDWRVVLLFDGSLAECKINRSQSSDQ